MKHMLVHRLTPKQFREDQKSNKYNRTTYRGKVKITELLLSITKTPWAFEILNELE